MHLQAAKYDFMYGVQYAWNLVIFNMVLSFSLTTPIIVPFGKPCCDTCGMMFASNGVHYFSQCGVNSDGH